MCDAFDATLVARFVELARAGLRAHVLGHADEGIPLQECPTCGPTLVVRREHEAGAHIVCRNCASDVELVPQAAGVCAVPTGRTGGAVDVAPSPDNALIGRLVANTVRTLPVEELQRLCLGVAS